MKIKISVVQDSPEFFNKNATFEKIGRIVSDQASKGCDLLVFPESFVPGYPRGFDFGAKIGSRKAEGRELYSEYYKNSIDVSGNDLRILEKIAKSQNIYLIIGVTEKENSNG